ncbi:TIGR03564 family F420-dependent LLM class oxidoreductase [Actinomarinicola tropica]|uniref:TIGR03564 family F420-dependent LLM class oxidoreductase n=1 Tax=Actinomarinicola tropica TaxID=2789776 RepID=A0A5Q2RKN5_9ACTN|nr:TIGR03564 family F420-dependent LLM class oxidoreductase [Actinomarinicola tropica]QGG96393.1 TIGR03564 family F420-dependent LLM class oxidoreductase [Actinomarinicola tropica]
MRIGLSGGASSVDKMIEQAKRAEADGFAALWYPGAIGGDPLVAMAMAGRETSTIELGTSIVQTYTCHPVLQANRAASVAAAMGREGFTLGIGPSHHPVIEGVYGMDYGHAGRHTEEYVEILAPLLRGEEVDVQGEDWTLHGAGRAAPPTHRVPLLVAALGPRLLRVAGAMADGTVLWMGNARAIESHVAPRITRAAESAGRPAPRIVAGLPVAVTDDVDAARAAAAEQFVVYGQLPNYQRILEHGGVEGPAQAAIVGDEESVAAQITGLFDAGATDVWAAIFPVGDDRGASRARTRALLKDLAND